VTISLTNLCEPDAFTACSGEQAVLRGCLGRHLFQRDPISSYGSSRVCFAWASPPVKRPGPWDILKYLVALDTSRRDSRLGLK
jgi:hypothetical protein